MSFKRSLLLTGLLSAASQSFALDNARQIAESNVAKWNEAFAKGKVDDILSLYAQDAMLVQPNGEVSRSAGEIRAFWQHLISQRAGVFEIDIVEAKGGKDGTIVTTAKLSDLKTLPDKTHQVLKYNYDGLLYSVLKRQSDGSWKAQVQQWSDKSKG